MSSRCGTWEEIRRERERERERALSKQRRRVRAMQSTSAAEISYFCPRPSATFDARFLAKSV